MQRARIAITTLLICTACTASDTSPTTTDQPEQNMRAILDTSLERGRSFLLHNQKAEGNFEYEYNFVDRTFSPDDNQVRQAGALWGLALIHHDNPTVETREALERGFAFFREHAKTLPDGRMIIAYPGDDHGGTGTVSLVILALTEFLRTEGSIALQEKYQPFYEGLLQFLRTLRKADGHFDSDYDLSGQSYGYADPYANGEALLAMAKAAKYRGHSELWGEILGSAHRMHQTYITDALQEDPDSATTKGFYQWGTMSFFEIATSNKADPALFTTWAVNLAEWMIDVHKTLDRPRNTAYAYEGIISAWELARRAGDQTATEKLGHVIGEGLRKLTSWQVGGPIPNEYLLRNPTDDPHAVGGVMNHRAEPQLRIDVTQHQMHAVILARRYVYR